MNYKKRKLRKQFHLQMHQKRNKIPRNKCNQGGKNPYSENYTPLKEIKTQTNRSLYRVHGLERLTSLKCPYFLKQSIDLMRSVSKYR